MRLFQYASFLSLLLMMAACEEFPIQKDNRFPIQGRWRIKEVKIRHLNQRDSVVNRYLGYLVFGKCSKDKNNIGKCSSGLRIYDDGKTANFHFQTFWGGADTKGQKHLLLVTDLDDQADDLLGRYFINKLTNKELVFSCTNCDVGNNIHEPMYARFELKAVKE